MKSLAPGNGAVQTLRRMQRSQSSRRVIKRKAMDLHTPISAEAACSYLLRFTSLHDRGRGISVPCDKVGNVDIDSLTLRLRTAYFGARAMVGQEYSRPTVQQLQAK